MSVCSGLVIKAAARLPDVPGRVLLKWWRLQPFVPGSASHLAVQRLPACLPAFPGARQEAHSPAQQEKCAGAEPQLSLNNFQSCGGNVDEPLGWEGT